MKARLPSTFFLLISLFAVALVSTSKGTDYDRTPEAVPSAVYTVTVNGQSVEAEKFGDVSYARFVFSEKAEIVVKVNEPISEYTISPLNDHIAAAKTAEKLSFTLTQPKSLVISINNLEKLLLFADPAETDAPNIGGPGVTNLNNYLPKDRAPATPITLEIQKAIDETAAKNNGAGGVLFVPNGQYMTGQLKLRSNVHLYLQSGALIKALPDFTPENYPRQGTAPVDSSFIFIGDAKNVKITGRGVIDGNGLAVRTSDPKANIKLLRTAKVSGLLVDGVYFRNSSRWSLHVLYAENVIFQNVKLINDVRPADDAKIRNFLVTNTDGFDIDASNDVTVRDSFVYTGDDAVSIKVTNYLKLKRPAHHITVENNVLYSFKCGIRFGNESFDEIHDVVFKNNDLLRADRAVAIYSRDGGKVYALQILNNRAEYIGGDYNERLFLFRMEKENKKLQPGPIDQILIKDFFALKPARQASTIAGFEADCRTTNVSLENIVIDGKAVKTLADIPLKVGEFTENVTVK